MEGSATDGVFCSGEGRHRREGGVVSVVEADEDTGTVGNGVVGSPS